MILNFGAAGAISVALWATAHGMMPGPYPVIYKTEPSFTPSAIHLTDRTNNTDLFEPGYFFIAPHIKMNGYGPQIVDNNAELVWYGKDALRSAYGGDFYVCDLQGVIGKHLCWSEDRRANRILNDAYEPAIREFRNVDPLPVPDVHEFNVLPGGKSFLTVVYKKKPMDLRVYLGPEDGVVLDGCIQEVDIHTRKEIFHWCFLDHYEVHETFLYLLQDGGNPVNKSSPVSGKGTSGHPWDFMHVNAVDKNFEGDYLVSGRHLSQLLKIAGPNNVHGVKPGTVLWRLNGRHSDFTFPDKNAMFGRQHHCRFRHTGATESVISIFNNAFDGALGTTKNASEGLVLRLNNVTMEARIERVYINPKGHSSYAQGSMSVMPQTGNAVIGWGTFPEWSEFTKDGSLLFHARAYANGDSKLTQYRVFKFPWVGRPRTKPKVVAYCKTCAAFPTKSKDSSPVVAYVSWNGATEVAHWRFFLGPVTSKGPWFPAGTFPRSGFETKAHLTSFALDQVARFAPFVFVEALAANGSVLENAIARTFVPSGEIIDDCGDESCHKPDRFDYGTKFNESISCPIGWTPIILIPVLLLFLIETLDAFYMGAIGKVVVSSHAPSWDTAYQRVEYETPDTSEVLNGKA